MTTNLTGILWKMVKWPFMKKRLGFDGDEMELFRKNPRNVEVVSRAPDLMNKTIIVEVVDSHGCNSGHKKGDKLYLDAFGNLITGRCPGRVCIYALNAVSPQVFAANELIYAGADPNKMRFRRAACFDVGLACGGFGRVVMEISVKERNAAEEKAQNP